MSMARSVLLLSLLLFISIVSSAPSYEHIALQAADQCDWIGRLVFFAIFFISSLIHITILQNDFYT